MEVNLARKIAPSPGECGPAGRSAHLSTEADKPLRKVAHLGISSAMADPRIEQALSRIEAALARIAAAQAAAGAAQPAPAKVVELINTHERLREEVAETLRDLDALLEEIEG